MQGAALKSTISARTNSFIFSRTGQDGQSVSFSSNSQQLRSPGEMPCWRNAHHASPDFLAFLGNAALDVIRGVTNVVLMEVLEGLEGLMC